MKVLIVDDEYQACEGLMNRIDRMGFKQIDEISCFTNAREAIEKVECAPEESWIIITDIQMPEMDGLKMIKSMQSKLIHANYIVFSAYKDFDYAKEAIRLRVVEYLLKPCRYEELRETMDRILESLEYRQRLERKGEQKLNELLEQTRDLADGDLTELEGLFGKLNMNSYEAYTVVSLYPDVFKIKRFQTIYPMLRMNEGMEILVNHPKSVRVGELIRLFQEGWAGVSTQGGLEELHRITGEARRALNNRILFPPGTAIYYEDIRKEEGNGMISQLLVKNLSVELLRQGEDAVKEALKEIFAKENLGNPDGAFMKKLFVMLKGALHSLRLELMLQGGFEDRDFGELESMEEMTDYITNSYCALARELKVVEKETVVVQWAKEYVRGNLDKEINMAVVANRFDMNYYYFSRLFRSITGETFSQYLLKKRMQSAAELLGKGSEIGAAAEKTGYGNVKNFSRAFHNYYGMTPSEWKKRQGK